MISLRYLLDNQVTVTVLNLGLRKICGSHHILMAFRALKWEGIQLVPRVPDFRVVVFLLRLSDGLCSISHPLYTGFIPFPSSPFCNFPILSQVPSLIFTYLKADCHISPTLLCHPKVSLSSIETFLFALDCVCVYISHLSADLIHW